MSENSCMLVFQGNVWRLLVVWLSLLLLPLKIAPIYHICFQSSYERASSSLSLSKHATHTPPQISISSSLSTSVCQNVTALLSLPHSTSNKFWHQLRSKLFISPFLSRKGMSSCIWSPRLCTCCTWESWQCMLRLKKTLRQNLALMWKAEA